VKVLDSRGEGRVDDVVAGLEWCVNNGVRVINLSLGVTDHYVTLKNACDMAWAGGEGAVLCAASGNNEPVVYPGNYGSVISVGALDSADAVAAFSSEGPPVELTSPGVEVYSCGLGGTYARNSGTSFSAPHVAGAAALLFSTGRYSDAAHVRQHLRNTAKDLGAPGRDQAYGYGKLDAKKAFDSQGCSDVAAR
jgi:subtilisin family serine protease